MSSSAYSSLRRRDIIMWCHDLLKNKTLVLRDSDGKMETNLASTAWDIPWDFTVPKGTLNCFLWNNIMFNTVFPAVPQSLKTEKVWVPAGCQNCFKTVIRPKNLRQLFAVVELQKRLGWHAKCGVEHRPHVFGLYGGYWYSKGLEMGLQNYQLVRAAVDADPMLGPDISVILKRGCTEFEMRAGPSNEYELSEQQIYVEDLVNECFNIDLVDRRHPQHVIDYVHARWIEHAYQWGDDTVFDFLDPDNPPFPELVTYHHIIKEREAENA